MDMDMDGKFHIHGKPERQKSVSYMWIRMQLSAEKLSADGGIMSWLRPT